MAEQHGHEESWNRAVPASLGEPPDDIGSRYESDQITARRTQHVGEANALLRRASEHRQP